MKRAFIVKFETSTRVVVDIPEDFDPHSYNTVIASHREAVEKIVGKARENIVETPRFYLYAGNADITEDDLTESD